MNLLGKYLKEKSTQNKFYFYWYRLGFLDVIGLVFASLLLIYLFGEQLGWESVFGHKILKLNTTAKWILYFLECFLLIYLIFNRKSVLLFENDLIKFKKRPITSKTHKFKMNEVQRLSKKAQSKFYENDVGFYPDIYTVKIHLRSGQKFRLGSFNESDCNRLKSKFNTLHFTDR